MVMEMSFRSSFSFLLWGLEEGFSIGLEDHLAFILFTHINICLQTGVEEFYYRNFSSFSTADLPVACLLLTGERLEGSVDMLEVSSEGKNVFAVLAKYMIRLSESVSEAPCLAMLPPLPAESMKAAPAEALCICPEAARWVSSSPSVTQRGAPKWGPQEGSWCWAGLDFLLCEVP